MSSIERDSYVRGGRYRRLGEAAAILSEAEFMPNTTDEEFEDAIAFVIEATSSIVSWGSKMTLQNSCHLLSGPGSTWLSDWNYGNYQASVQAITDKAEQVKNGKEPEDDIERSLASAFRRTVRLNEAMVDLVRWNSMAGITNSLYTAPSEIFTYFRSESERFDRATVSNAAGVILATSISAAAKDVPFLPLIEGYLEVS